MATAYGLELDPGMHEEFDFTNWTERESVTFGPFTVTPFAVNHPVEEAYALRVEVTEPDKDGNLATRVLTYSGDTDSCTGLEEAAKDADLFLCEAAFEEGRDDDIKDVHLTGKRAGEAAAVAGARRLLLTHIPVWTSQAKVMAEARPVFPGDVAVAVAGVHYTI
jgi:ribonuclease BN (tRNA processing enzyme)